MGNVKIYLHNYLLSMLITDLQYFGTISYIKELFNTEQVGFDSNAPFSKMSFKNRLVIASAQGPLHLTIPIAGGRDQKTPMNKVVIAYDTPWRTQHIKAFITNYKRSPYFEYYIDSLESLYQTKTENLQTFLMQTQEWVKKQVKGNWTSVLITKDEANTDVLKPSTTNEIDRKFHPWLPKNFHLQTNPIIYQQVYQDKTGFIPNLSILDILFCCGGKQVANYLKMS